MVAFCDFRHTALLQYNIIVKTVRHTATLFYYDGPQVIEARDGIGGHYVAVMVDPVEGSPRYIVAGVDPERLRQFRGGELDLRSLLLERDEREWYLGTPKGESGTCIELEQHLGPLDNFKDLPESGFLLHEGRATNAAVREARARNSLIFDLSVDPPEAAQENRIRIGTLAALLSHVQTMVKHAYGAALRDLSFGTRQSLDRSDAHLLDVVVPAAAGSFRVVLAAAKGPDLIGRTELARALEKIDELFEPVSDPKHAATIVKNHRGHLAGAYLRLLRFLVQSKTGLHYEWAEPNFVQPRSRSVSEAQAGPLVDLLSGVANLGAETLVLVGALKKADVDNGTWRIATDEGDIAGKTKQGGPSLAGLKLESLYRFTCLEELEESESGREQRTIYLTEHEPV